MSRIMSGYELMELLGLHHPANDRPTCRWTPQEDARLKDMWRAGASIKTIGKTLRRRTESVCKRRSALGMAPRCPSSRRVMAGD